MSELASYLLIHIYANAIVVVVRGGGCLSLGKMSREWAQVCAVCERLSMA